jgi:hypothetical protein
MKRKTKDEKVRRWRHRTVKAECEPIRRKLMRWAQDNSASISEVPIPKLPEELDDRAMDNWEPLFILAQLIGGSWIEKIKNASLVLSGTRIEDDLNLLVPLLEDIGTLYSEREVDRLASNEITVYLATQESRPWPEWGRQQKPITPRQLSSLLKPLGIAPKPLWIDGKTVQGYELGFFTDAFARYPSPQIPDSQTQDTQEPSHSTDFGEFSIPKADPILGDEKTAETRAQPESLGTLGIETQGIEEERVLDGEKREVFKI